MAQVIAAGRHREVGAQAELGSGGVGEHERAGPDLLAGAVEEHVGRLQDVGGDMGEARGLEDAQDHRALRLQRGPLGHGTSYRACQPRASTSLTAPLATIVLDGADHLGLGHRDLRGPRLAPFLATVDAFGHLGALDQVLDLNLAAGALVVALDHHARGAALVGVFHLRLHAGRAEIEFGADAGVAQFAHQPLMLADALAVHDQHHDGGKRRPLLDAPQRLQRRIEPRHADGEPGRRHQFAAEPGHEVVVAPAAADGAEADGAAGFVGGLEGQLGLEDGAGVIFEAADHRRIDADAIRAIACRPDDLRNGFDRPQAFLSRLRLFEVAMSGGELLLDVAAGFDDAEDGADLLLVEPGSLGEIAGLVLAPCAEQLFDALDTQPVQLVDGPHDGHPRHLAVLAGDPDGLHDAVEHLAELNLIT
jgi:hypothetical protein